MKAKAVLLLIGIFYSSIALAQTSGMTAEALANSMFYDHNGDGKVVVIAFGDSLTRGVGDFYSPSQHILGKIPAPDSEAGYPLRVETYTGVNVSNYGDPGEEIAVTGFERLVSAVAAARPDVVILMEGTNDAIHLLGSREYNVLVQTEINIITSAGAEPVLITLLPVTANGSGLSPFIDAYNNEIRGLAVYNMTSLVDAHQAFENTCGQIEGCKLYNLPDGKHPNELGYDVFGEMVTATLLNINLLDPTGPQAFEQALGLAAGSTRTIPNQ